MSLETGKTLGPYEILEPLGAGGMGEVYLGEDTRLGRRVAIKVLPAEFAADDERRARFEQEARAAAALNHPHIAVVHDIGVDGDGADATHFMVQELLEGEPLGERIGRGPLPVPDSIALAAEISEALGAAHRAGVIHRDLKPDNVFVTANGHAKVLDFGLAKLTQATLPGGSASMSPTMLGTLAGEVLGTAGYMAPEQISGEETDGRADIFAFGCVLYEMATGRRAFAGESVVQTLSKIAHDEPEPVAEIAPKAPTELRRILRKCLSKTPARRYQSAEDLTVDLRLLQEDMAAGTAAVPGDPTPAKAGSGTTAVRRLLPWGVAAAATLVAAASFLGREAPTPSAQPRFVPLGPYPINMGSEERGLVDISPDGQRIVYVADSRLYLLDLTTPEDAQPIRGTEGGADPAFSPDGEWIAFAAASEIRKVRPSAGLPVRVAPGVTSPFGLAWAEDDRIVYVPGWGAPVMAIPASGGEPEELAAPDRANGEDGYAQPWLLPDGKHLLYSAWRSEWNLEILSLDTGEVRELVEGGHGARYTPTGHLLYAQDGALLASRFDTATMQVGAPRVVVENLGMRLGSGIAYYGVSRNGTLVALESPAVAGRELWRVDLDGSRTLLTEERGAFFDLELSPDGRWLAMAIEDPRQGRNLGLLEVERGLLSPLTSGRRWNRSPRFSADGSELLYSQEDEEHIGFSVLSLDSGEWRRASPGDIHERDETWSPGGVIAWPRGRAEAADPSLDIWMLEPEAAEPELLLGGPGHQSLPAFSPDGAHLAYTSDTSGREEIYVIPYPRPATARPWQVSREGGTRPYWTADSTKIYFRNGRQLHAADVLPGSEFRTGRATMVLDGIDEQWHLSADGSFVVTLDLLPQPRLNIALDWFTELQRLVPSEP